jgi:hypothetical protein
MEEPWDELMGPSAEDLKNMLREKEPPAAVTPVKPAAAALRSPSSAPPPADMFSSLPGRWSQHDDAPSMANNTSYASTANNTSYASSTSAASDVTSNRRGGAFAEEDDEEEILQRSLEANMHSTASSQRDDPVAIRQEALKVLEVAELQDSPYTVHRTKTGGFTATVREKKRVPSALSGLNFTSSTRSSSTRYRDDPYQEQQPSQDDYEYGDENVVDVMAMERRSLPSRPQESSSNWSSRYSIDNTLLALSGGATSSKKILDQMDQDNNMTRNNIFGNSNPAPTVFGSGFSFRKNQVFGKQDVTIPTENLRTVWMDVEGSDLPPANNRSKTWQEQLAQKRRQRRNYVLGVCFATILAVALASIFGSHRRNPSSSSAASNTNTAPGSVTFTVTSGPPERLDFSELSPQTTFLMHLGNLQDAAVTLCPAQQYATAAAILKDSPTPTFVLVGPDDASNCPLPEKAWQYWTDNFSFFHRHFQHSFEVMSEADHTENFAIVEGGVLFVGLHVVGGRDSASEFNYEWVEGMIKKQGGDVRAMVLFGHARPGEPINQDFFDRTSQYLAKHFEKPIAYVHAGDKTEVYQPFENKNILAIQVGSEDTPLARINVGFGERPFIIG